MASHGVPRVSGARPQSAQTRENELQDIENYKALVDMINIKIKECQYSVELLRLTSRLLKKNPEFYTIWNHRRLLMEHQFSHPLPETSTNAGDLETIGRNKAIVELISNDLDFQFPLLRKFPKCYWIWNYRLWLLEKSSKLLPMIDARRFWRQDLGLASKMLSTDSRNFLGWGYRRTVVAALESSILNADNTPHSMTEEEFNYTTKMIESNLSNFSAWHNRSKLIPRLLDERKADDVVRRSFLDKELKIIQRGLWTDSDDQSLWFYHQYLMCTFDPEYAFKSMAPSLTNGERVAYVKEQQEDLLEMLDGAEDCKWIYQALIQLSIIHRVLENECSVDKSLIHDWISHLRILDPLRKGRWNDLERKILEF